MKRNSFYSQNFDAIMVIKTFLLRFLYLIKEIDQSHEKIQILFINLYYSKISILNKGMARKLEKRRYEICPYA